MSVTKALEKDNKAIFRSSKIPTYKTIPLKGLNEEENKNYGMDTGSIKNRQSAELRR